MKKLLTVTAALALAASAAPAPARAQAAGKMKVVSFTGQVQFRLPDGSIVGIVPGAAVPELPSGSQATVVSGEAVFATGSGVSVSAKEGDSFGYTASADGGAQVAALTSGTSVKVAVGSSEATVAGGTTVAVTFPSQGQAAVSVVKGRASVSVDGQARTLSAGQSVSVANASAAPASAPAAAEQAPASSGGSMLGAVSQYKQGNIRFGNLELHPTAGVSQSYDSNIYLVPKDEPNGVHQGGGVRSAWITRASAGLGFKLPVTAIHSFDGMYDFANNDYSKQGKTNNYIEQSAGLGY
ncbi:MAG: hypothetical protein KGL53_17145, partial [Elusimicrobia bacterium]|nr:hypothetical protein [Elusimicrobiota bacterium]